MTRSRRLGTALTLLAATAALSIGGSAAAAAPAERAPGAGLLSQFTQASPNPDHTRGRGGYGYGPTTPPAGELPSTPPGGELPSTAPAGEVPSPGPSGVSPAHVPGELPVTGAPLVLVAAAGGVLAAAGLSLRYAARRRRP